MGWGSSSAVQVDNITIDKNVNSQLEIKGGAVTDAMVATNAGIVLSKLALGSSAQIIVCNSSGVPTFVSSSGDVTVDNTGAFVIGANKISNAMISTSAAIAYSKLSLANGIMNGDVSTSAGIVYSKLNLSNGIVNGDISASAGIMLSKLASGSSAQIPVCNGSGVPTYVSVAGDMTMNNAGVFSVAKGLKYVTSQSWTNTTSGTTFTVSGQNTYLVMIFCKKTASSSGVVLRMTFNALTGGYTYNTRTSGSTSYANNDSSLVLVQDPSTGTNGGYAATVEIYARDQSWQTNTCVVGSAWGYAFDFSNAQADGNFLVTTLQDLTSIVITSGMNTTGTAILFQYVGA